MSQTVETNPNNILHSNETKHIEVFWKSVRNPSFGERKVSRVMGGGGVHFPTLYLGLVRMLPF